MQKREFKDYAKEKDLNQNNYPWTWLTDLSKTGRTASIVLLVINIVLQMILKSKHILNFLINQNKVDLAKSMLNIYNTLRRFNKYLVIAVVVFSILKILSYALRSHSFERDIRQNEKEARKLKNKIITISGVRSKLNKVHKSVNKSKDSASYDDKAKIKAYNSILDMDVRIHTRESLEDGSIKKLYKIRIKLPKDALAEKNALDELKNYNIVATKACGGLIQFGQYTVTNDRTIAEFLEEVIVPDKYVQTVKEDNTQPKQFESVFPKSLFTDRSKEKEEKIEAAERFGNQTAKSVDTILATKGLQAIRTKVTAGSSNVLIVYQLSLNLASDGLNSLSEALDKALRVKGTSVTIEAGDLKIAVPVPKSLSLPIDLPSMYAETFG